jgi:hypothetical protein
LFRRTVDRRACARRKKPIACKHSQYQTSQRLKHSPKARNINRENKQAKTQL